MRTRYMRSTFLWLFVALAFARPGWSSTGAGNGGDVLDRYLNATRTSLIDVLSFIKHGVETDSLCRCRQDPPQDVYCAELKGLSKSQGQLCRDFILSTVDEMLFLNQKDPATALRLTERKLFVSDSQGEKRPVSAKTNLGPEGDILFNYDRVEHLSPMATLSLVAHEFGHKVAFGGRYISDNERVGAFDFPDGGRRLMDAVGAALSTYAADQGKIGKYFFLEDRFSCRILLGTGQGFSAKGASQRLFTGKHGSLQFYDTGLGNSPRDFQCSILENFGTSKLSLQLQIHEEKGCRELTGTSQRWTRLKLIREPLNEEREEGQLQILAEQNYLNFNPLCEPDSNAPLLKLTYQEGESQYEFSTRYLGSVGKTDGYVR